MARKKKTGEKQSSFEELMERLEDIAGELESGELGLEKAIARYEEGVKCYQQCHKILSDAEKKVEILTRGETGELEAVPFEGAAAADADADEASEDENDASLF
ncbi:MAG TPA: exodeoxyribonuclease VII small subunit [Planctomycetota bacterium]|nr:exodeoxyribonuclease VII small subunit [Planctomycetota bacterium]